MFVKVTVPDVFSEKSKRLKHFKKAKAPNPQNLTGVREMEPSEEQPRPSAISFISEGRMKIKFHFRREEMRYHEDRDRGDLQAL